MRKADRNSVPPAFVKREGVPYGNRHAALSRVLDGERARLTAIDLTFVNDDDAKRQAANLRAATMLNFGWASAGDTFEIAKEEFGLFGVKIRGSVMDRPSRSNA